MRIPESFTLFGQKITVTLDPTILVDDDNHGEAVYRRNQILLGPSSPTWPRSREQIEQVFCHELVHFIYNAMGEADLKKNEKHVDLFASLLHQALNTQEGEIHDC